MSLVAAHGFSRVLTLVVAMAMATLPFIGDLPPWLTLGILILATWRVLAEQRGLVVIPPVSIRLLLALLVASILMLTNTLGFGLAAATPLFVGFLWIKLLELKARRDYLLACFLSYFLVAVLLFDRSSLTISLYAIATMTVITMALIGYHLDARPGRIIRMGIRLVVTALPLAVILFLFFPRIQMNLSNLGQATSGFTNAMTPGDVARLALSDEPVMRVEFPNDDMPAVDQLYFRGLVMSQTDGETWKKSDNLTRYSGTPQPIKPNLPIVLQDITMEPMNSRWLFALESPLSVPKGTVLVSNRTVFRRYKPTQTLRYRVESRIGDAATDIDDDSRYVPPDTDARVRQLAASWRDAGGSTEDILQRALAHFRTNGFTYSLSPGVMEGDDIADFLFNKKSGFCSHYATALAMLMRCAGVPARLVVGFHRGELNPLGGFLILRHNHAHAWSEVRIGNQWHRVDPTVGLPLAPGETQPAALRNASSNPLGTSDQRPWWIPDWAYGPYERASQMWQYAEARWESTVMGYDLAAQTSWLGQLGIATYTIPILIGAVVVSGVIAMIIMIWWQRDRSYKIRQDPLVRWYERLCTRLATLGVVRDPWEGPRDFTTRAANQLPAHAATITELGQRYIALRYGQEALTPAVLRDLEQSLRTLPKQAKTAASAPVHAA